MINPHSENIKAIKMLDRNVSYVMTGGGSLFVSDLLCGGGASNVFMFADMLYSRESIDKYLGVAPRKYCSEDTTSLLCDSLFLKSRSIVLSSQWDKTVCIAANATLRNKDDQREDRKNNIYISGVNFKDGIKFSVSSSFTLDNKLTRFDQEKLCSYLIGEMTLLISRRENSLVIDNQGVKINEFSISYK